MNQNNNQNNMDQKSLVVAGLFSGIGGFELGFERAGFNTSLMCEIDEGARQVLNVRFPDKEIVEDVRDIDRLPGNIDVLSAGFPCQNLSSVGLKEGIDGEQSGLVNEVFRILRSRPTEWVIIENVPFMLKLNSGFAMNTIMTSLEELGYNWAYRVIDSSSFLPQRRKRVYIVASLNNDPRNVLLSDDYSEVYSNYNLFSQAPEIPIGFYWTEGKYSVGFAGNSVPPLKAGSTIGIPSPPAILFPDGRAVTPDIRDAERLQGFEPDWTCPAEEVVRKSIRWKLIGNAVTVDVIEWLGNKIKNPRNYDESSDIPLANNRGWHNAGWSMGNGRYASNVSDKPFTGFQIGLDEFLEFEPKPLSIRATNGFIKRAREGNLNFPPNFIELLQKHKDWMEVRLVNA
ncbi:DNA (cytosine-5-)-methyltransferase [Peribacillus sp. Bi134]|uniref:DNA cytosine methyltransferase n=1 Tax=Peribacillus sp. Bi134 TaxID=2884272 RepID=UPI001D825C27|nr:DNA (cytosine-5-)-methyltransferase [Peribacillus sp. Bi134]CAH0298517.1 putative BsuMI modification methylase subunit YdiP [Peribacillus sp. Bi134]